MNEEMKGFWKYFALLVAGAVINLTGGILGKTSLGYILFFLGLAIVLAGFVFVFIKKAYFKADRLKVLILGLFLSLLLGASITLLLNNTFVRSTASSGSLLSMGGSTRGAYSFGQTGGFGGNGTYRNNSGTSGTTSSQSGSTTGTTTNTYAARARANSLAAVLLGWLFLVAGGILLLVTVIRLLTKKVNYSGERWKVLLLGLLVGAMLSTSTSMLLTHRTMRRNFNPGQMTNGQAFSGTPMAPSANGTMMVPPDGQGNAGAPAQATATPEPTLTATPTMAPTSTPLATATATTQVYENLVVCLDYNIQYGINIRDFPADTGRAVGTIPAAGCFTIDGKNSQYPGWYHFASGQNGMGSIQISSSADDNNLWVFGKTFDATADELSHLPEVAVPTTK